MSSDDGVSPGDSSSDDEKSDEFEEEDMEEKEGGEEEEEGFVADDARSQVTFDFDDENITPGNPFSAMLPPQAERLFRKDLPKPVNAGSIKKSNYRETILKPNAGI